MVVSLRKWWNRAKFIALFLLATFVVYHLLQTVSSWLAPHTRFGEPSAGAVKVHAVEDGADDRADFRDRLRFFYWYGE